MDDQHVIDDLFVRVSARVILFEEEVAVLEGVLQTAAADDQSGILGQTLEQEVDLVVDSLSVELYVLGTDLPSE